MTIGRETLKTKWEQAKKFVKDHPLQIAAGVGAVAGLYLGYKFGIKIGFDKGVLKCDHDWYGDLPQLADHYGMNGCFATIEFMKKFTPEAEKALGEFIDQHINDENYESIKSLFWNNECVKGSLIETYKAAIARGVKIDWTPESLGVFK